MADRDIERVKELISYIVLTILFTFTLAKDRPVPRNLLGKPSIFRLLDSMVSQLRHQDHVTVVFDGKDVGNVTSAVGDILSKMPGLNSLIMEQKNANDWGATVRNKHMLREGDFMMFADDDNWFEPDAFDTVRTVVQHDFDALYVFQYRHSQLPNYFIPELDINGEVEPGNVDTGCGVVPIKHSHLSNWPEGDYEADGKFYHKLSEVMPRTYLVKKVIFVYNGH
ncbi:g5429 [Coccomyxa elongata]